MEVNPTPLVLADLFAIKQDRTLMRSLEAEYTCLQKHGKEMCTESAFDCLIKVHGKD